MLRDIGLQGHAFSMWYEERGGETPVLTFLAYGTPGLPIFMVFVRPAFRWEWRTAGSLGWAQDGTVARAIGEFFLLTVRACRQK